MGIYLLTKYVSKHELFKEHQLHDTVLIIDGANLMGIFNQKINDDRKDHMFGGDYNYFAHELRNFFTVLKQCNVRPLFIKEILWAKVFSDVLYEFNIKKYVSSAEADDLIAKEAVKLNAPILSSDSDFFILDLPAGVIFVTSLLENLKVQINADGKNYISCKLFTVDEFENKFPGLNRKLLPIVAKPLLNEKCNFILSILTQFNEKINQIPALFKWLSQQNSVESAIEKLENIYQNNIEHQVLIANIRNNNKNANNHDNYSNLNDDNCVEPNALPNYLLKGSVSKIIQQIYNNRIDVFYPVFGNKHQEEPTYACSFELCRQIYGMLRVTDNVNDEQNQITQYFCGQEKNITPEYCEKVTGKMLPNILEIKNLTEKNRLSLFWNVLEVDSTLNEKLKFIFKKNNVKNIKDIEMIQFCSVFSSFIYFERNFKINLFIEFIYALLLNILLSGYIAKSIDGFEKTFQYFSHIPNLSKYDIIPKTEFTPQITYYNNAFQCCIDRITLLSQVLNVQEYWCVYDIIFGFQGSLVYNLTKELIKTEAPWSHLKKNILKNSAVWPIYEELVVLALDLSERKLDAFLIDENCQQQLQQKIVIPETKLTKAKKGGKQKLITRGFEKKVQ
ncbi:Protein asteroid 1 [Tyrophagus putrescentiae]|nr:Protein asteroid 1 [Tyrophagus putrescentiae]